MRLFWGLLTSLLTSVAWAGDYSAAYRAGYRSGTQAVDQARQAFVRYVDTAVAAQLAAGAHTGQATAPVSGAALLVGHPFQDSTTALTSVSVAGATVTVCFAGRVLSQEAYLGWVKALVSKSAALAAADCAPSAVQVPTSFPAIVRGTKAFTLPTFYDAVGAVPGYLQLVGRTGRLLLRFAAPRTTWSDPQQLVVLNQGAVPVQVSASSVPNRFRVVHTCASAIPPGGTCTVTIDFQPEVRARVTEVIQLSWIGVPPDPEPTPSPGTMVIPVTGYGY